MKDTIIGVSGSYDIKENSVEKAAIKYKKDIEHESNIRTVPLYRSDIMGIDNVKFMYPLAGVPIIAYTLLNAVDQNCEVRVTGNDEVENLVDLMNSEFNFGIKFNHEGKDLSLANSLLKLFSEDIGKGNYFVTGDVPFAKNYTTSNYDGDVVLDLNTENLIKPFTYISRNFYNKGKRQNQHLGFKEPNVYYFSNTGFGTIQEAANIFFENRKGGGLSHAVGEYLKSKYQSDEMFKKGLKKNKFRFAIEVSKAFFQKFSIPTPAINFDKLNPVISKDLYGIDWRFEFLHNDIFRMLDIDGLNNDYVLYNGIANKLEQRDKLDERLVKVRNAINSNKNLFPVVINFESIIGEYINQVNEHLEDNLKLKFENLDKFCEMYQNKNSINELTNHFLVSGKKL
jgi:hypothetical protein